MTGAEMERAIEFILQIQAKHEARLGELGEKTNQLTEQIAETNRIVQFHAETQTAFIQTVTRHIEAQGEINASLRASINQADVRIKQTGARIKQADVKIKQADVRINQADARINQTDTKITRTDTRLDRLEALVERYIEGRSNGQG
jgi:chromosome segregation ATPase